MNNAITLELARFKVSPDNVDAMLADRPGAIEHISGAYPAFVGSRLVRLGPDEFMDIVEWTSLEAANKAAEEVPEHPECQLYFRHMSELVSMDHATVVA
ncbi:MAG: hypothetical protein GXP35_16145 [Actinobacteria bacterium]|nr:hypothetical protein [Actinomycetota bacterium]